MIFKIKENSHSCSPLKIKMWCKGEMYGTFILHSNMWYDRTAYGSHLNKLVGFSNDLFNDDSTRLVWRPSLEKGKFEIYAYIHLSGKWVRSARLRDDLVLTVFEEVMYSWAIVTEVETQEGNNARFVVGGSSIERAYDVRPSCGWFMQFYYGGVPKSMQYMSCDITVEGYV